jgi:N-acetylglucosamine-6-phosphate deacetylase
MTIAPERPGGFELLAWLLARGIVVSLGHTDADATSAGRAFDGGAKAVTHLYNAQRRFAPRDPGISGAALTRDDVIVQVIADLVHLAPETLMMAWRCAAGRLALVTDAIGPARAASGPGEYRLGDRTVFVDEGSARLADGTLAGSVLSLDRAVRNMTDLGAPLAEVIDAVTRVPASLVGRRELGTLSPGTTADVTVLDDALVPRRTLVFGRELWNG